MLSRECLTTINYNLLHDHKIFVTTNASDFQSGAVLSFGKTWETAHPVAFNSMTFKGTELNYPVLEKEMLAIIQVLRRWRSDLLGVLFFVYTDHKTVQNFNTQRDLSRRQARWMEFMAQYKCKIVYLKGSCNTVADALSCTVFHEGTSTDAEHVVSTPYAPEPTETHVMLVKPALDSAWACACQLASIAPITEPPSTTLTITADEHILSAIHAGYAKDKWYTKLLNASPTPHGITTQNGLLYITGRLVVPCIPSIHETLFHL